MPELAFPGLLSFSTIQGLSLPIGCLPLSKVFGRFLLRVCTEILTDAIGAGYLIPKISLAEQFPEALHPYPAWLKPSFNIYCTWEEPRKKVNQIGSNGYFRTDSNRFTEWVMFPSSAGESFEERSECEQVFLFARLGRGGVVRRF